MTTRNLRFFLHPASIAVIGASDKPDSIGGIAARNLLESGFSGDMHLINRRNTTINGQKTLRSVWDLEHAPELAVIATPTKTVPDILRSLGELGTRAAIVLTSDFRDYPPEQRNEMRDAMLRASQPHVMRIIGPDSLGIVSSPASVNASFTPIQPPAGRLAFVAQSGANLTAAADWAIDHGIGFSHLISLGDMCDADSGDWLDYLATDPDTDAILLYLRNVTQARKFMSAARSASRMKPVIVFRGGRFPPDASDIQDGIQLQPDAVYDAAFRRAGMLRVTSFEAFFEAVNTLARVSRFRGERLAILTNGYNVGLIARDALLERDGRLAELTDDLRGALDKALPGQWWGRNPLNLRYDADSERYERALSTLLSSRDIDAVVVLYSPTALTSSTDNAEAVIRATKHHRNVLVNWLGGQSVREARARFAAAGIPDYDTPDQAIHAFMQVIEYQRNQRQLMEIPASIPEFHTDIDRAHRVIAMALSEDREWLDESETKSILAAYGIGVVETHRAADADAVHRIAQSIDAPVAVKIDSPDVGHKGEVAGVTLNLDTADAARNAARAMAQRLHRINPEARLEGFIVQPMMRQQGLHELLAGIAWDEVFGPVVYFGHGGAGVKARDDMGVALPPLNMSLARDLMAHTRIHRILEGTGDLPAADLDAIAFVLIQLGQLASDLAEVQELRINPLLASPEGAVALDAGMRVKPASSPAQARLAIRPYPQELEQDFEVANGETLRLRPILPEDEPALVRAFQRLSTQERYYRFFSSLPELPHSMAARLSQIDYDREMAWALTEDAPPGHAEILAVARLIAEPDYERAEYALAVGSPQAGQGIGTRLMQILLDYARSRGIQEVYGEVLSENRSMLHICEKLGFTRRRDPADMSVMHVSLKLSEWSRSQQS